MGNSKRIKRGDFIILLVTGIVAAFLFLWKFVSEKMANHSSDSNDDGKDTLIARIERNGQRTEIDLNAIGDEPQYIHFDDGMKVTIIAERGRIRFLESECPDQICVHTGWLEKQGDVAACLPAKTVVTL